MKGLLRFVIRFIVLFAILLVLLPLAAGLFGVWSGQALFIPMLQATYTYLLPYTLSASGAIALVIAGVSEVVRYFRSKSTR